nr:ribosomal protein S8 [Haslea silbo]QUS63797.1 ribosomal protein S8 [Haslea silbo]
MKNYFWNMFAIIKNGQLARRAFVYQKQKKICEAFLKILWSEGFILGYKILPEEQNSIKIFLKYVNGQPAINTIKLITKPGRRVYYSVKQIWKIDSNETFIIFSTNKGLKTIKECKKLNIGGEAFILIN